MDELPPGTDPECASTNPAPLTLNVEREAVDATPRRVLIIRTESASGNAAALELKVEREAAEATALFAPCDAPLKITLNSHKCRVFL